MRKRKAKVVWLPADLENRLGVAPGKASIANASSTIIKIFTGPNLGDPADSEEIPIVKDFGPTTGQGILVEDSATLADIEQSGYRLRRIVGKLGFSALQGAAGATATIFHVTAGFIIRRVDTDGTSLASASAAQRDINVANIANHMDPWIWRRSWDIADTTAAAVATDPNSAAFAPSNYSFAGNFDGPHVDAKTARIVGPEERLFLSVTVEGINGAAQGVPGGVLLIGDIRVLASMRTNTGNRRNASR